MKLSYTIYQSTALLPPLSVEHNRILAACKKHNSKNKVTGFLHREGDFFLQYLEGPLLAVEDTMQRIGKDSRHKDVEILDTGPLDHRRFPDWQMGFVDGNQLSLHSLLEAEPGKLNLKAEDPFDIVIFMAANADSLRQDLGNSGA